MTLGFQPISLLVHLGNFEWSGLGGSRVCCHHFNQLSNMFSQQSDIAASKSSIAMHSGHFVIFSRKLLQITQLRRCISGPRRWYVRSKSSNWNRNEYEYGESYPKQKHWTNDTHAIENWRKKKRAPTSKSSTALESSPCRLQRDPNMYPLVFRRMLR